jgi:hypothetical protein
MPIPVIAIVEDDPDVPAFMQELLEWKGYRVVGCPGSAGAWTAPDRLAIDARVIMLCAPAAWHGEPVPGPALDGGGQRCSRVLGRRRDVATSWHGACTLRPP